MILTPLETILITTIAALVSALAMHIFKEDRYINRKEYDALKRDNALIFAMLRAVITYMDNLTSEQREEIINMQSRVER